MRFRGIKYIEKNKHRFVTLRKKVKKRKIRERRKKVWFRDTRYSVARFRP